MKSLTSYIHEQGASLSESEIATFCATELRPLGQKLLSSLRPDRTVLIARLQFLIRVAGEFDDYAHSPGISMARREAVFALKYFMDDHDAIPDTDPEFGLKDDEIIAGEVIARHQGVLEPFAGACGQSWARMEVEWRG